MKSSWIFLALFVQYASSERISNAESPTWGRRATMEPGSYGARPIGDRTPTFEGDQELVVRPYDFSATDSPRRFTHTWERSDAPTRASYLSGLTTQDPLYNYNNRGSSAVGYPSGSGSSGAGYPAGSAASSYVTARRNSYQTDKWGDVITGGATTQSSLYSAYDRTTDRWGSSGSDRTTDRWGSSGSDRDSAWGSGSSSGGRVTARYGSYGSLTTDRYSSGSDRNRDRESPSAGYGSSAGSPYAARDRFDRNEAYLRIETELVKLTNEKGITSTGSSCDTFGACDTLCYGYIDTERPNAEFPGSRDNKYWPKLFETDDNNSPAFTRANLTREVCGVPYREAVLRVLCEDRDSVGASDLINKWDCNIQRDPEGETYATWHTGDCVPKFQADKMKLTFRYKIFQVPRTRCDPSTGALQSSTPTTKRRN